ncbi:MAG: hypothetical protein ACK41E_10960 [Deinococcales bacterium]
MQYVLMLLVLVACSGTPQPPPVVPPDPNPNDELIQLSTNPAPQNFIVARGQSQKLIITGRLLSPAVQKIKVSITRSPDVTTDPTELILTGNSSGEITVTVPQNASNNKPFFRVQGSALNASNNPVTSREPSLLFQWTVPTAPTVP